MTRGDQRDRAREKNAKKLAQQKSHEARNDGLSTAQRKARDAEIMREKQKAAAEKPKS